MTRKCGLCFIQLNLLIFCDLLLTSVLVRGRIPIRTLEAGRWGTACSASGLPSFFLLMRFPLTFSLAIFPFISNSARSTLREVFQMDVLVTFSLIELEDLDLGESGTRADFPPSQGITNANAPTRADGQSLPLTQAHSHPVLGLLWTNENRNGRFERWRERWGGQKVCKHRFVLRVVQHNTSLSSSSRGSLIQNELETASSEYLGLYRSP